MSIPLNKLKHVVMLAEQGNFARAADKLHISQPALSRSIAGLEDDLGLRLFDRNQAGAALTAVGKQLVNRARDLLHAAANLQQEMDHLREGEAGEIAFGVGPFVAASFLPDVLTELAREHPRLRTVIEVNNSAFLTEHLVAEQFEFFIADIRTVKPNSGIRLEKLGRQYGGLFCRPDHALSGRGPVAKAALQGQVFAGARYPEIMLPTVRKALGIAPDQDVPLITTCDNVSALKRLTMGSDALLMCTYAAVQDTVESGDLIELKVADWPAVYADVGIVSLERRSRSPMAELVLAKVRKLHACSE